MGQLAGRWADARQSKGDLAAKRGHRVVCIDLVNGLILLYFISWLIHCPKSSINNNMSAAFQNREYKHKQFDDKMKQSSVQERGIYDNNPSRKG